jgi:hypothetical protein
MVVSQVKTANFEFPQGPCSQLMSPLPSTPFILSRCPSLTGPESAVKPEEAFRTVIAPVFFRKKKIVPDFRQSTSFLKFEPACKGILEQGKHRKFGIEIRMKMTLVAGMLLRIVANKGRMTYSGNEDRCPCG